MVETYFAIRVYSLYVMLAILAVCCIVILITLIQDKKKK